MRLLLLSPYHSGSHQAWAEGYRQFSQHHVTLLTMPGRFWKWRMHGGGITLSRKFLVSVANSLKNEGNLGEKSRNLPDVIVATDMVDMTTFLALTRKVTADLPCGLYMHENQLTYPLPPDANTGPMRRQRGERDLHYAFVNFVSMMAVDRVYFNSDYHRLSFFRELPKFLNHFPEYKESQSYDVLIEKSSTLPVGINYSFLKNFPTTIEPAIEPPLILWNHRWEFDKNPLLFFNLLYQLDRDGLDFEVAICGQQFRQLPEEFLSAKERLGNRIIYFGHAPKDDYARLLRKATIVVSTAIHEFFGVSVAEAIFATSFPVLPKSLAYPELIPAEFQEKCLFQDEIDALIKLRWALKNPIKALKIAQQITEESIKYFDWQYLAPLYDQTFQALTEDRH